MRLPTSEALVSKLISWHLKYWVLGALLTVVLAGLGLRLATKIKLDSDLEALLPAKAPSVAAYRILKGKSGGSQDFRVLLQGGSLDDKLKASEEFSKFLKAQPHFVQSVRYRTPKDFFEKHKYMFIPMDSLEALENRVDQERRKHADVTDPFGLEAATNRDETAPTSNSKDVENDSKADLESAKELLNRLDEMKPYYQTDDGKSLAIRILPASDSLNITRNKELLARLQKAISDFDFSKYSPDIKVDILGSIPDQIQRYESILSDLSYGGLGVILILLIVALYFRTLWAPLIAAPPLVLGLAFGLGLISIVEKSLNSIAIFLVLVVFGMGIEFGVHLLARYLQERATKPVGEALRQTWLSTGRATLTSSTALLFGFALLTISSFQGFAQFGRVAIVLIISTAICFLVFMPTWILVVEKIRRERPWGPSFARLESQLPQRTWSLWRWMRYLSIPVGIAVALICALFLRFDYEFEDTSKRSASREREIMGRIFNERLKASAVASFSDPKEAFDFMEYYRKNRADYPDIALMSGLSTFYPIDQKARIDKLRLIADSIEPGWVKRMEDPQVRRALKEIYDNAYNYEPYTLDEVPPEIREPFIATDGSNDHLVFIFDIGGKTDGRKAIKFAKSVDQFIADSEAKPIVSGTEIIFADIVKRVIGEGPWLVFGMMLLVFLTCWFDFRNFRDAFFTMAPVIYGFLMTGALLVIFKYQINFYNMVALASLGAMVVDNSIHLYHRYRENRELGLSREAERATWATAPTILTCTATSIAGYGGMVFASSAGISSLGKVAVLGLFCCFISAVIFFPAWLMKAQKSH